MSSPTVMPALTEKQWQAQVVDLAHLRGWTTYHPFLSIRSPRGFPDLTLVRPPRIMFAELKAQKGKLTPAQVEWLGLLAQCPGVEVFVWKPSDFDHVREMLW